MKRDQLKTFSATVGTLATSYLAFRSTELGLVEGFSGWEVAAAILGLVGVIIVLMGLADLHSKKGEHAPFMTILGSCIILALLIGTYV